MEAELTTLHITNVEAEWLRKLFDGLACGRKTSAGYPYEL
jgi:hypothetical protein